MVPMLSSGQLTLLTFCVVAAFIILGMLSMRRHIRRIRAPFEADLSEQGRAAQDFEHTTRN